MHCSVSKHTGDVFSAMTSKDGSGGVLSAQDGRGCVVSINNCEIYNSRVDLERFGGALYVEINYY